MYSGVNLSRNTCRKIGLNAFPTGSPKYGTTRKNTQRYYITKRLIRYIYHLSNAYCYCKMIKCYNPVAGKISKMPKNNIFFLFSRNENFGKSNVRFQLKSVAPERIWLKFWAAYFQIIFLQNRVGDFCFLFPFWRNRHFFEGSADDLPPLTLS